MALILNQRLINFINKYISFITVSLDGDITKRNASDIKDTLNKSYMK